MCMYTSLNGIRDDNMYFLWEMNKCVGVVFSMMPHTHSHSDGQTRIVGKEGRDEGEKRHFMMGQKI